PTQRLFSLKGSDARAEEIRHNTIFPSNNRMQELKKSDTTPFFFGLVGLDCCLNLITATALSQLIMFNNGRRLISTDLI
ncbi:MAG: hypothetical protein K6A77_05165, partial [Clostridiales bacterium]|nr:hypothetical protein [Clostridiales bacterium]